MLVGKTEGKKRLLGRWEDNIKIDLRGCELDFMNSE
jgi:hypothetical protein